MSTKKKKGRVAARAANPAETRSPLVGRLVTLMDACAVARSNAAWTQGYRARYEADMPKRSLGGADEAEAKRLYEKEIAQWGVVTRVERRFRRMASHILRLAAQSARKPATRARAKSLPPTRLPHE